MKPKMDVIDSFHREGNYLLYIWFTEIWEGKQSSIPKCSELSKILPLLLGIDLHKEEEEIRRRVVLLDLLQFVVNNPLVH